MNAYICDGIRTPFGRYGGVLSSIRPDDLAALVLKELQSRNPSANWGSIDEVILGCANQAGEDNRNVARMAALLAGFPVQTPGITLNRLCASGLESISMASRAIKSGEADFILAGGVESMSRAPFVMGKAESAFSRTANIYDTTIGWRFVNPLMEKLYGSESMPETGENVAQDFSISREDQDQFALASQQKYRAAQGKGYFEDELMPVSVPRRKAEPLTVNKDEHPRPDTTLEMLAALKTPFRDGGTVTAGNASGVNDGACALIIASEDGVKTHQLTPRAKVLGSLAVGVDPRVMGIGPLPAVKALLQKVGLSIDEIDVIELNEAFSSQALAVMRGLGLGDQDPRVNPNGGAIALGHPLGASGSRLVLTALRQLEKSGGRYALCTMCVGVGQGSALLIERV